MCYELVVYFPIIQKYETTYFAAEYAEDMGESLVAIIDDLCAKNHTLIYQIVRIWAQEVNKMEED